MVHACVAMSGMRSPWPRYAWAMPHNLNLAGWIGDAGTTQGSEIAWQRN
jgi:hypothetical protein